MRRMLLFSLVISNFIVFAFPSATGAQATRDPQALQMLYGTFWAMGGAAKNTIRDVRLEGTLALPSAPDAGIGTFVVKARGSDLSIEADRNGQQMAYKILNGSGSLRINGKTKALPAYNTLGLSLDIVPLFARWAEFEQPTTSTQSLGPGDLDGSRCYFIRVESGDGSADPFRGNNHGKMDVCVDQDTGLVAAIRYRATQGPFVADEVTVENRFSGYQQFAGISVPSKITRYINGLPALVLRVKEVHFNNGFTDTDFHN